MIYCGRGQFATHNHSLMVIVTLFGAIALSAAAALWSAKASIPLAVTSAVPRSSFTTKMLAGPISQTDSCDSTRTFSQLNETSALPARRNSSKTVDVNPYETLEYDSTFTLMRRSSPVMACHRIAPGESDTVELFETQAYCGVADCVIFTTMSKRAIAAKNPMAIFMAGGF